MLIGLVHEASQRSLKKGSIHKICHKMTVLYGLIKEVHRDRARRGTNTYASRRSVLIGRNSLKAVDACGEDFYAHAALERW
jgi:hypothetical protein